MIIVKEISTVPPVTSGPVGTFAPEVRIIAGPKELYYRDGSDDRIVWGFFVNLPVTSAKLANRAYKALPESVEHDGRTYCRCGMRASDCVAWYIRHG